MFHQDNAPTCMLVAVMAKVKELKSRLHPLQPYSADLVPREF